MITLAACRALVCSGDETRGKEDLSEVRNTEGTNQGVIGEINKVSEIFGE